MSFNYDYIVQDSTIWTDASRMPIMPGGRIFTGIVISVVEGDGEDEPIIDVEIETPDGRTRVFCRQMIKSGDVYNYEERPLRSPKVSIDMVSKIKEIPHSYASRVGETVVVAIIGDLFKEGVILGGIRHPAQKRESDSGEYLSIFNGLKTSIKTDGSYTVTFQGKNLSEEAINLVPFMPVIPPAVYVPALKGSFFGFDAKGSYEVSDAALALPQSIKIDKVGGSINIESGTVSMKMEKLTSKLSMSAIDAEMSFTKSFKVTTLDTEISSLKSVKIKSAQIAIGFGSVELLDLIDKLIDAVGLLTPIHPLGPCSPLTATPTWAQIIALKAQLNLIKGSL